MSRDTLPVREAYRLWAPGYAAETAVSALEDHGVRGVTPPLAGRALLDVGCGIGRRMPASARARTVVGVDLVYEMLAQQSAPRRPALAAADVRSLPIRAAAFDVVWCRLVLGHLPDLVPGYCELARVAAAGARLVVTDFHPDARAAGHTRTFRDVAGRSHAVEHYDHTAEMHLGAAEACGWKSTDRIDLEVGAMIRPIYERAGALERYEQQLGLKLVILFVFEL